jgi:predicted Ser/Thr protein kinase
VQVELNEDGTEVELGKGAFGVVVKGSYRLAPVAIKRLRDQTPEQQRQFLKEMAILRACRGSRYVVPFVGASLQPVCPSCLAWAPLIPRHGRMTALE